MMELGAAAARRRGPLRRGADLLAGADPLAAADQGRRSSSRRAAARWASALASGIGVQAALPDKTVLAVSGDGGAMYTIQALWSAARHNLPIKFIICNNGSYRLLQLNISQYWSEQGVKDRDFPMSFDLSKPDLQFAEMAKAMGVAGRRVETAEQIVPAVEEMLAHDGPFLLDVVLEGNVHPELIGVRCGQ